MHKRKHTAVRDFHGCPTVITTFAPLSKPAEKILSALDRSSEQEELRLHVGYPQRGFSALVSQLVKRGLIERAWHEATNITIIRTTDIGAAVAHLIRTERGIK